MESLMSFESAVGWEKQAWEHGLLSSSHEIRFEADSKTVRLVNNEKCKEFHYDAALSDFLDVLTLVE
jgi:hypothetical protein